MQRAICRMTLVLTSVPAACAYTDTKFRLTRHSCKLVDHP